VRIRQVRPEFWTDETIAALPDAARLFYIGLWNVADDAGWLEWQPHRIGALLYPYRQIRKRERDIVAWGTLLADDGRLRVYECGCAEIPTLPRHQRITGKQTFTVRDRHYGKHSVATGASQVLTVSPVTERNVTVGNVTRAKANGENGGFKERLAAAGGKKP